MRPGDRMPRLQGVRRLSGPAGKKMKIQKRPDFRSPAFRPDRPDRPASPICAKPLIDKDFRCKPRFLWTTLLKAGRQSAASRAPQGFPCDARLKGNRSGPL